MKKNGRPVLLIGVFLLLFVMWTSSVYAANISINVADDGYNLLAKDISSIKNVTSCDAVIRIEGIASEAKAQIGVRIKTSGEKTVYLYQDAADQYGNFRFEIPVEGFEPDTYEIVISGQASETSIRRYFRIAPEQVPVGAHDVFDCFTVNGKAVQFDKSKVATVVIKDDELDTMPVINISTVDKNAKVDIFPPVVQKAPCAMRITVTFSDNTSSVYSLILNEEDANRIITNFSAPYGASKYIIETIHLGSSPEDGTLVYNDRSNVYWSTSSSAVFEGATTIRRSKSDANGAVSDDSLIEGFPKISDRPYYGGPYSGQNGEPYWMSFTVGDDATVFMADSHKKGWPNNDGTWKNNSGYVVSHLGGGASASGANLYYKEVKAGETVYIPNYGLKEGWPAPEGQVWDPPAYAVVWKSNGRIEGINADLAKITYSVNGGEEKKINGFEADNSDCTIRVPKGATVRLFLTKSDENATIDKWYDEQIYFNGGELEKDIRVVSAGGIVEKTYTVRFIEKTESKIWGDISLDNAVDSSDAILALRYALGLSIPDTYDEDAGDVDGSGKVDSSDAIFILRHSLKLNLPDDINVGKERK